jgi:hypothetical protein
MLRNVRALVLGALALACAGASPTPITFPSGDGVTCTADLYRVHPDPATPFIVLFHQAGYSRGEYREIAPRLNPDFAFEREAPGFQEAFNFRVQEFGTGE